jgi:hypothetical protein
MILEDQDLDFDSEWTVEMAGYEHLEAESERCSNSEIGLVMGDFADCDNWALEDFSDLLHGMA